MAEAKEDIKQTEESGDRSLDDLSALKLDQNGYPLRPQPSDDPLGKHRLPYGNLRYISDLHS